MPHALVTGGAGFIGSHLCAALLRQGFDVTCIDDFRTGSRENIQDLKRLRVIEADANQWSTFQPLVSEKFDIVFHYAATVGVRLTEEQPSTVLEDVLGIAHIARLAREGVAKRVIFASSSEVYGDSENMPLQEDTGNLAWSPYTAVKMYGEHTMHALWEQNNIPTMSLRFFNVYGPRQRSSTYGFVVAQFIKQALTGQPIQIFGDGTQTRDFVFIDDNINAALTAASHAKAQGQAINVGFGHEISILDLARLILTLTGRSEATALAFLPARKIEIMRRSASTIYMTQVLGATPATSLEEGLHQAIESLKAELAVEAPTPMPASLQETSLGLAAAVGQVEA